MTTLVMPHGPTPSPEPVHTPSGPIRYVAVRANLLPDELVTSRRSGALKHRVLAGLGAVLAIMIVWYGITLWGTSSARHDLSTAKNQNKTMQAQQTKYDKLVQAQQQSTAIKGALAQLMSGDLQWKDMLAALRGAAPHGVKIDSISGTTGAAAGAANGAAGSAGLGVFNTTGKANVGTLTITGTAPNKDQVAAFVDSLSAVQGVTAVYPTSATTAGSGVSFAISALITSDALGGRFSTQSAGTGGN
jgi:Tfp pilus assembly protein PilN